MKARSIFWSGFSFNLTLCILLTLQYDWIPLSRGPYEPWTLKKFKDKSGVNQSMPYSEPAANNGAQ